MLYSSGDSTRYKEAIASYDARKYPICAPHDGSKGLSFRRFADDFLTNIASYDLKDLNETFDLAETLIGTDEGGSTAPPGAAAPLPLPVEAKLHTDVARSASSSVTSCSTNT